jgi:hypothetical protein
MKYIKHFENYEDKSVAVQNLGIEDVRKINNLYKVLADYIDSVLLEDLNVFDWSFYNAYFLDKDIERFNIILDTAGDTYQKCEAAIIKGIKVPCGKKAKEKLVKQTDKINQLKSLIKEEDVDDILSENIMEFKTDRWDYNTLLIKLDFKDYKQNSFGIYYKN